MKWCPKLMVFRLSLMLFISGCVSNPGIVQLSPDTYLLSRSDKAGVFGSVPAMKAEVIREASEFAASQGKVAIPISMEDTPAYPFHFATFDYQFQLVDKSPPKAKQSNLYPELIKLDDLRKLGILNEAEYELQKKKLLDSN